MDGGLEMGALSSPVDQGHILLWNTQVAVVLSMLDGSEWFASHTSFLLGRRFLRTSAKQHFILVWITMSTRKGCGYMPFSI